MTPEQAKKEIENFLITLTESIPDCHIQVLFTCNIAGLTKSFNTGIGNWYARQGLAHEFINSDIAQETAAQIAYKLNPPNA